MSWGQKLLAISAVVDDEIMARQSIFDRRRYAVIGGAVLFNAILAGCGWGWKSFLVLHDAEWRLPVAISIGVFASIGMWQIERILIGSIKPGGGIIGRLFGFALRLPIAILIASLIALPYTLADFSDKIAGRLDDKRLALMEGAHAKIDGIFDLPKLTAKIGDVDVLLEANRAQHDQLPLEVRELSAQSARCDDGARALRTSTQQRIQNLTAQIGYWRKRITDGLEEPATAQPHINWLNAEIGNQRRSLAVKEQECVGLAMQLGSARSKYFADVDSERAVLIERRRQQEHVLERATAEAKGTLEKSERAIALRTAPGVIAQGEVLFELVRDNLFDRIVVALYFCFFLLVDLLPMLSKVLPSPSTYDRRLAERERKAALEIKGNLAHAEAEASVRKLEAASILAGAKRFHKAPKAQAFYELSQHRFELYVDKMQANSLIEHTDAALASVHELLLRIDEIERRYARTPAVASQLEGVRAMLDGALRKVTGIFGHRFDAHTLSTPAE